MLILFVDGTIIDIRFSSSRDSMLRVTRDAYVEFANEADQRLALSLHQKLYNGNCIKGGLCCCFLVCLEIFKFFCLEWLFPGKQSEYYLH